MCEFYEIDRDEGMVILPKASLALAVATEGNIHFSVKTGLKRAMQGQNPQTEQEVIEAVDIKTSRPKAEVEAILYDIMILDYKVVNIVNEVKSRDADAQLRYSYAPILIYKPKIEGAQELRVPLDAIQNIDEAKNEITGQPEIKLTVANGQTIHLGVSDAFDGYIPFVSELNKQSQERLVKELDLAQFGVVSFR